MKKSLEGTALQELEPVMRDHAMSLKTEKKTR
jgi:hypothetical protein